MRISIDAPGGRCDLALADADAEVPLADLLSAAGWTEPPATVLVDDHRHHVTDMLAAVNLLEGSEITSAKERDGQALVELVRLAGVGAGQHLRLDAGVYDVGSSTGAEPTLARPDHPDFRVTVLPNGATTIKPLTSQVFVERASNAVDGSQVVATPDAVYRVEPITATRPKTRRREAGRLVATRAPRLFASPARQVLDAPVPPEPTSPAMPISWLVALAPVPIGIVLAFVFSPFFLAFAAMSPAISVARWRDNKKRERINRVGEARETAQRLRDFAGAIRSQADDESKTQRDHYCDVRRQQRAVAEATGQLWEVRPDHLDYLHVTVGLGERNWTPEISYRAEMDGLDEVVNACGFLVAAPVSVGLRDVRGIGLVGDLGQARRLGAAMLLESVVRQGPADVELSCLLDATTAPIWDWIKWLAHIGNGAGEARVALNDRAARSLLDRPAQPGYRSSTESYEDAATSLVVVDGNEHLASGLTAVASLVNRHDAVAIVIAERAEDLPAFCGAVAEINHAGTVRLTDVARGQVTSGLLAPLAHPATVERTARLMARYRDIDSIDEATELVERCQFSDAHAVPLTGDALSQSWGRHRDASTTGLRATLGVCVDGRFDIDLVRDGPHALVAGTTGSGKSELLRTLVASLAWRYSPEQVTFVLIDFKGGGAFDACANLPHTVGVVTDLNTSLAARALRCLQAELRFRERELRSAGVSDIADLGAEADPLPRLIIIVDEFATLAKELPGFVDSLVDVAQRGRSLGIHLVLATQRPAGVVDAKIRANTNLRIALRVQDDNDAVEVIGSTTAASIHRSQAGRAFARLGVGEVVAFQTAIVSEPPPRGTAGGLRLSPFQLCARDTDLAPDLATRPGLEEVPSELERITVLAQSAATQLGIGTPRVPWPAPLPDDVDLGHLEQMQPGNSTPWTAAVGLVDRPDEQRRDVFYWSGMDDGNALVYGVESAASAGVLSTYCTAIARGHDATQAHLYIVDFAGALSALADLPNVGGYLGPEDDERIGRLLDLLDEQLEARRRIQRDKRVSGLGPEDVPMTAVFIANYSGVLEHFDEAGDLEAATRLAAIVRDGPALGVFTFASGAGERGIPMKVASQVPTKFVMRLADPTGYTSFGLRAAEVPEMGPGRAIDVRSKLEVQFAWANHDVAHVGFGPVLRPSPSLGGPVVLRTLEPAIEFSPTAMASAVTPDLWRLAVGLSYEDLSVAHLELRTGVHAVIAGPPVSGRSTALRTIAAALESQTNDIAIGSIGVELGQPLESAAKLETFAEQGGLLLVDDIEFMPVELAPVFDRLVASPPTGLRIVVTGRSDTLRGMTPTIRLLTAGRTGMLLRPQADAGDVFRVRLRFKGPFPAGRGVLLNNGVGGIVQLAHETRVTTVA